MPRLLGMIVLFGSVVKFSTVSVGIVLMLAFFAFNVISLARRRYKKPLVWTRRVGRLFWTMTGLSAVVAGICVAVLGVAGIEAKLFVGAFVLLALYLLSSVVVLLANKLLEPVEKSINRRYYNEAASILRSMPDLKVIGITGSYGKTSTKHYLYRILAESYDVAMTPGSFNTTLGVVRTVREYLKPYNEVFIVEMGAKQPWRHKGNM